MYAAPVSENIPNGFECPLLLEVMEEPVIAADGHSYERSEIQRYFASGQNRSPITREVFDNQNLIANRALKKAIADWKAKIAKPVALGAAAADASIGLRSQNFSRGDLRYEASAANTLGKGSFGIVYRGEWKGQPAAVKQMVEGIFKPEAQAVFQRELALLTGAPHPCVMVFYGAVMDAQPYCIVMDLMKRSLFELLGSQEELSWSERYRLGIEIGAGLSHLHGHQIVHGDLRSRNILLDERNRVRISDVGLSHLYPSQENTAWMAPELLEESPSVYSDAYAYGMTLWELASRQLPFAGKNQKQIIFAIAKNQRPEVPAETPAVFRQVMEGAWVAGPPLRFLPDRMVQTLGMEISRQKHILEAQLQSGQQAVTAFETQIAQSQKQIASAEHQQGVAQQVLHRSREEIATAVVSESRARQVQEQTRQRISQIQEQLKRVQEELARAQAELARGEIEAREAAQAQVKVSQGIVVTEREAAEAMQAQGQAQQRMAEAQRQAVAKGLEIQGLQREFQQLVMGVAFAPVLSPVPAPVIIAPPVFLGMAAVEPVIPEPVLGEYREGGVVFYVDRATRRALVSAVRDIGLFAWGLQGVETNTKETGFFSGKGNTYRLFALGAGYAAAVAAVGYSEGAYRDWYLPSKDELYEMYQQRAIINQEALRRGGAAFFEKQSPRHFEWAYWSSSESFAGCAWSVFFNLGPQGYSSRPGTLSVRPVRAFNY